MGTQTPGEEPSKKKGNEENKEDDIDDLKKEGQNMPIDESCDYKEYYIKFNEEETGNQSFEKIVFKKNQSLNADN